MSLAHPVVVVPGGITDPVLLDFSPRPKSLFSMGMDVESSRYWSPKWNEEEELKAIEPSELVTAKVKGEVV